MTDKQMPVAAAVFAERCQGEEKLMLPKHIKLIY